MLFSVSLSGSGVDLLLIVISLIILIGYISEIVFRLTRLPEVLILMGIGILLGPVLGLLPQAYVSVLRGLTPLFGSLALVMIMFNGGKIIKLRKSSVIDSTGYVLAFADTILPGIIIGIFMWLVFQWPLIYGLLLGVILGETSVIMVLPLLKKIKIESRMYNIIAIENTFNSVFSILIFYLLLVPIEGSALSVPAYIQYSVSYISIAIMVGLGAGLGWLLVQNIFKGARGYLASIAIAILLYGFVDFFNGAAVVAVLIYAVIIGNSKAVNRFLKFSRGNETTRAGTAEKDMEFLVRTFFFVLIGIIATLSTYYFIFALVITMLLIVVRKIEVRGILRYENYRDLVFSLMPRGLTVAVLSSIYLATGLAYSQQIFYIAFMVIILTNISFAILARQAARRL